MERRVVEMVCRVVEIELCTAEKQLCTAEMELCIVEKQHCNAEIVNLVFEALIKTQMAKIFFALKDNYV